MDILVSEPIAKNLRFDADNMWVELADSRILGVPLAYFPRLLSATSQQRQSYTISGGGTGLHWEEIDEDICVKALMMGIGDRTKWSRPRLIRLKVKPDQAQKILRMVDNRKYLDALESHWQVFEDGHPRAQSICWLFCWAKTGINSKRVAQEATDVFNRLFDKSFEWFDRRVPHNWARDARYKQNIESELERYLKGD